VRRRKEKRRRLKKLDSFFFGFLQDDAFKAVRLSDEK